MLALQIINVCVCFFNRLNTLEMSSGECRGRQCQRKHPKEARGQRGISCDLCVISESVKTLKPVAEGFFSRQRQPNNFLFPKI